MLLPRGWCIRHRRELSYVPSLDIRRESHYLSHACLSNPQPSPLLCSVGFENDLHDFPSRMRSVACAVRPARALRSADARLLFRNRRNIIDTPRSVRNLCKCLFLIPKSHVFFKSLHVLYSHKKFSVWLHVYFFTTHAAFIDSFKISPPLKKKYPVLKTSCQITFGALFIILRLLCSTFVSLQAFWYYSQISAEDIKSVKSRSLFLEYSALLANIGLMYLQYYWGTVVITSLGTIFKGLVAAEKGRDKNM